MTMAENQAPEKSKEIVELGDEAKKLTDADWKQRLTEEEYHVTREKGTERPFTGEYHDFKEDGSYHCTCCGAHLFDSDSKYNAGCGWPSFYRAKKENLVEEEDTSFDMVRTEVMCKNCGAHQGHLFDDGPSRHGGMRYCINSASLKFKAKQDKK